MQATPSAIDKETIPHAFDGAAAKYDLLTSLNPGYHRHLRMSAQRLELGRAPRVLDLCCGTGLSTEAILAVYPDARVVGLDASSGMLDVARDKRVLRGVEWVLGDATDPAAAGVRGPFDGVLMAYGIRNVPDADRCLANVRALLAPGGALCLHEYSVADSTRARWTWDAVTLGIVIPLGKIVGGDAGIYRYLRRSVHEFDGARALSGRLARVGLRDVRALPMDGWQRGVVHSFVARR